MNFTGQIFADQVSGFMPGTTRELRMKSGLDESTINHVIAFLQGEGELDYIVREYRDGSIELVWRRTAAKGTP